MGSLLPDELLLRSLEDQYPCRELQIRQLTTLLNPCLPPLPCLVVHGLEATGKTAVIKRILESNSTAYAFINCQECITARHLLERTVASCQDAIEEMDEGSTSQKGYSRCESMSALAVQLQELLHRKLRFVLVFDGIDRQREAPPTLLPTLARLGEIIPQLTVVLIVTAPRPRFLHAAGIPHVHFSPYNREQSLKILAASPRYIFEDKPPSPSGGYTSSEAEGDSVFVWTRFCGAVWDSLARGAARDIVSFRAVADRLWKPFIAPILDGTYGTRDFSKLMVKNRALFQGDAILVDSIVPGEARQRHGIQTRKVHDLPYHTNYLLCAAYLASYNPARQDPVYFMKASEKKRRKKGGGTAVGRVAKHRKIQRRLLGPQAFVMERMLAIFHAILPRPVTSAADILTQIATLASLRLLVRTSGTADPLEGQTKWRVNVGWPYIQNLARTVKFEIEEYLAE
ncbi:MAG: hypothetical protein M1835_006848 [Candelina submexicana]|nr:MAG: hypothetical protein M1835_006848 [Candelina submexicana]